MIDGKKICVVLPAYNASLTLERTLKEIRSEIVQSNDIGKEGGQQIKYKRQRSYHAGEASYFQSHDIEAK